MLAGGQSEEAASLDIAGWLQDLGLAQYVQTFRENEVDLEVRIWISSKRPRRLTQTPLFINCL
jgi:hypothetical protein